jgi:hypothetical protein
MAMSEMNPTHVGDALPPTCGAPEEKGIERRSRSKLGPIGEKARCPDA